MLSVLSSESFDSILVRLKEMAKRERQTKYGSFDSILVRLKEPHWNLYNHILETRFDSILVRLKALSFSVSRPHALA